MRGRPRLLLVLLALLIAPANALARDEPVKERGNPGPPRTPLQQAREEAGDPARTPTRYPLPLGELRVTPSELLASATGREIHFEATLDRPQPGARVTVRLPAAWVRTPPSGIRASRPPRPGAGDRLARSGRDVELQFASGERQAAFTVENVGIPAGTYELPLTVRTPAGRTLRAASATVRVFAAVREAAPPPGEQWRGLPRTTLNASNDAVEQSEVFVAASPGNAQRFGLGINGDAGMLAYVTQTGGQSFSPGQPLPPTVDAPGKVAPETAAVCCDPTFVAGDSGDLWFGGLSFANGPTNPSRILVDRIPAGSSMLQPVTTGLRQTGSGTQDKPMMAIDNHPSSPTHGRLYAVWGQPGTRIAVTSCDTRPAGVLNAARCDNADNWSALSYATGPADGSYIYADVAVGPDGKVYVTWWDYSSDNAIEGAVSTDGGTSFGSQQTIAVLDHTGGNPLPFACPILVAPGGRVAPSPGVEVDSTGRVYVSWGDLRPGSGSTRCEIADPVSGDGTPPRASHLTWDAFAASAVGGFPGGADPSASAGTRLSRDGNPGEAANSDDFFPWLAVDPVTDAAWADFYSTAEDSTRRSVHFYATSLAPDGGTLRVGPADRVSTAPSSYATSPCCTFGNDFGDYESLAVTQSQAIPAWSDNSSGTRDGEAFAWTGPLATVGFDNAGNSAVEAAGDGDGVIEPGETVRISETARNTGTERATGITGALSTATPGAAVTQAQSGYPDADPGATASNGTPFELALSPSVDCTKPVALSLALSSAQGSEPVGFDVAVACSGQPPAPTATPAPTASPAPTATPSPKPLGGLRSLSALSPQRLGTVRRRGVLARVSCRAGCDAVLELRLDARTARRYHLPRRIGRLAVHAGGPTLTVRIRLSSRARRALRNARRLNVELRATVPLARAGDVGRLTRRIMLR